MRFSTKKFFGSSLEDEIAKFEEKKKQEQTSVFQTLEADFCPIPAKGDLREKFIYFYKPYNFEANTKTKMTFDEDVDWEKA